ncbi:MULTISPECIES: hypothetical protein [Alphaproteobacteria]|uniref:hypothetical protein n=1 Tax=Alphaproteobacteria TaxID=28211 RepID=UPI00329803B4
MSRRTHDVAQAYKGRRKRVNDGEIRRLVTQGVSKAWITRNLGVSCLTAYRALEPLKPNNKL